MGVVLYSKSNCPSCIKAKNTLSMRGLAYTEIDLGNQSLKEAFENQFPHVTTVPFIIIDNVQIRGYEKLNEYFSNADREFLTEG